MKKVLCILVLFAVVVQTTASGIIFVQFELNRSYIAKNLCVKKEEKGNCCQGSCHLKKQLNETEKKDTSPASPNVKTPAFLHFCQQHTGVRLVPSTFSTKLFSPYLFSKTSAAPSAIFHPPTC